MRPKTIVFGEVGLSGEVRAVSQAEIRVSEAQKLGFERVVLPIKNARQVSAQNIELIPVETIADALKKSMPRV